MRVPKKPRQAIDAALLLCEREEVFSLYVPHVPLVHRGGPAVERFATSGSLSCRHYKSKQNLPEGASFSFFFGEALAATI